MALTFEQELDLLAKDKSMEIVRDPLGPFLWENGTLKTLLLDFYKEAEKLRRSIDAKR